MEIREMAEGIRQVFEATGWDAGAPIGKEEAERLEMAIRGEAGRYTITAHRLGHKPCYTGVPRGWREGATASACDRRSG